MNKVIIGLGSNLDPHENMVRAKKLVCTHYPILKESQVITTAPIGYTEQPDFLNATILIETSLGQDALKQSLKNIENDLGRQASSIKYGPRTIDLDIVVWNEKIVDQDFYERDFLKKLVLEIIPDLKY